MKHPAKYHLDIAWRAILVMALCVNADFAKAHTGITPDSAVIHHRFVFFARWAIAYTGDRKQLTPPYELLVTSDSIDCYLPFMGRMYTVPRPEELQFMSIRFTSKKFSYMETRKRSGWDVTIRPADVRQVQELYFSILGNGSTTLTIRSAGRDPMTYEGTIEPVID